MKYLTLLIPLLAVWQLNNVDPKNVTAPYLTTTLEQLDGSSVKVRFRAVHWDPIIAAAIFDVEETRNYYNQFILPNVAALENNVQITIGTKRLNPGQYTMGIEILAQDQTTLLISDENQTVMRIPVQLTIEQGTVPNLSIVFTPGVTDRDFVFNVLYGTYSVTLKWRFSGVPARPAEIAEYEAQRNPMSSLNNRMDAEPINPQNNINQAQENVLEMNDRMTPQLAETVQDPKVLGGLTTVQDSSSGVQPATGGAIRNATALYQILQTQAGSGAFRLLNIQP